MGTFPQQSGDKNHFVVVCTQNSCLSFVVDYFWIKAKSEHFHQNAEFQSQPSLSYVNCHSNIFSKLHLITNNTNTQKSCWWCQEDAPLYIPRGKQISLKKITNNVTLRQNVLHSFPLYTRAFIFSPNEVLGKHLARGGSSHTWNFRINVIILWQQAVYS